MFLFLKVKFKTDSYLKFYHYRWIFWKHAYLQNPCPSTLPCYQMLKRKGTPTIGTSLILAHPSSKEARQLESMSQWMRNVGMALHTMVEIEKALQNYYHLLQMILLTILSKITWLVGGWMGSIIQLKKLLKKSYLKQLIIHESQMVWHSRYLILPSIIFMERLFIISFIHAHCRIRFIITNSCFP